MVVRTKKSKIIHKAFILGTTATLFMTTSFANPHLSDWAVRPYQAAMDAQIVPDRLMYDGINMQQPITREEYAELMVRYFMTFEPQTLQGKDVFKDSANPYVQLAGRIGIVNGVAPEKFSPDAKLTREQASTMFDRVDKKVAEELGRAINNSTKPLTFKDKDKVADWAKEGVANMSEMKVIQGFPDGTFKPQDSMTREQAVVVAARMLKEEGKVKFSEEKPVIPEAPESTLNYTTDYAGICDNELGCTESQKAFLLKRWAKMYKNGIAVVHVSGNQVNIPWNDKTTITSFDVTREHTQGGIIQDLWTVRGHTSEPKGVSLVPYYIVTDNNILEMTSGTWRVDETPVFKERTGFKSKCIEYKGIMIDNSFRDKKAIIILFDKPTSLGNAIGDKLPANW